MGGFIINGKFLTQRTTGVQRYAFELTKRILSQTSEGSVAIPTPEQVLQHYCLDFKKTVIHGKGNVYWEQVSLPKALLASKKPLLINLCNMAPIFYPNNIVCIHDIGYLKYPDFFSKTFYYYYKFIVPRLIKSSKHIITVSEQSKTDIISNFKVTESKISVIGNGVSDKILRTDVSFSEPPLNRPYYLFVGSMDPRKNLTFLLEAYRLAAVKETALVIVGGQSKSFNNELNNRVADYATNPNILFYGNISDERLADLYRYAKAVIVPSIYEGFGLPIIEGLANGCNVFASDIPVFHEVGGHSVKYFSLSDHDELIGLLREQDSLSTNIVNSTDETVNTKFNWDHSADALRKLIEKFR